ncbi:MAG: hypothetical protein ACLTXL_09855 [Clostridia bacterium]
MSGAQWHEPRAKEHYRKMKKLYAIPLPVGARKISAIEEALMNGGDLSGLL